MTQRTRYSISSKQFEQFPILIFLRNWRYQICLYKEITMINTSCDHTFSPHNKIVFDANDANSRRENLHTYIERSEPSPPLPHPLPPSSPSSLAPVPVKKFRNVFHYKIKRRSFERSSFEWTIRGEGVREKEKKETRSDFSFLITRSNVNWDEMAERGRMEKQVA